MTTIEAAELLRTMDHVLILTHVRPDGDTLGSASALCQALRDIGKEAYLLENKGITETFKPYASSYFAPASFVPAFIVSTDIATLKLLPENAKPYADKIDFAIDHHESFEGFGKQNCVQGDKAACGEIVYAIIENLTTITPTIARLIYIAISTDTGCFMYSNTSANTHAIASKIFALTDVSDINKAVFRTKSKTRLAMESRMVAEMELYDNNRIVVMKIPYSLVKEMHATDTDIEELSALAALVGGTDCGITLREIAKNLIKISVRAGGRINSSEACKLLGGGGHEGAAGATLKGTMDEVKEQVLSACLKVAKN